MGGIASLIETGLSIINKFIDDPAAKAKARSELMMMNQKELEALVSSDVAQNKVNREEAKADSLFKSGWRPAAGWSCVAGLFYTAIGKPMLIFVMSLVVVLTNYPVDTIPELPSLEMTDLMTLLFGLLGLGAYRSYDKKQILK